jgi:7-carboxy-7-deazaguanine synthase
MQIEGEQKMSKHFEVSEIFFSSEGESVFTSHPTMYIRFARCNFKCSLFNNPTQARTETGYAPLGFIASDYKSLQDIPNITRGCDSQYAVNPEFSHMWKQMTADEIVAEMIALLPKGKWVHPVTGLPVILSLTGGEPTLLWKRWHEILDHPNMADCKHVLIETNCAVPFKEDFIGELGQWLQADTRRKLTWSNSPKLSSSGEEWSRAIRPEVAVMQHKLKVAFGSKVTQYFKFVCDDSEEDYAEVKRAMAEYHAAGIPQDSQIWIMPMACTEEQQQEISQAVARRCMEEGWLYCHRMQNTLWGNGVGT